MKSSYLKLPKRELEKRAKSAWNLLNPCRICPRNCGVDRTSEVPGFKRGFCQVGKTLLLSAHHPHFGEERCLVGTGGSGTIFFTSCNLA
ncbi:MAG: putative pyruvate formate lyase activating enzyme, partial [Microgenomates group bacterium LiPW_16]